MASSMFQVNFLPARKLEPELEDELFDGLKLEPELVDELFDGLKLDPEFEDELFGLKLEP